MGSLVSNRSFERGFQSLGKIQSSFRVHFFLIMLIFVVFDVEIVMLLGFVVGGSFFFFTLILLFFFLVFGLYIEWFFNKLN
jgi:NADH-ubiquinone oxidoreductase chain 3